jgi:hypothetical protein
MDNGFTVHAPHALADGKRRILLGVRPEKFRMYETHETIPDAYNRMPGTVRVASYMGVSTQYQVDLPGDRRLTVFEQNVARATKAELWAPGEEVVVGWQPQHSFVEGRGAPAPTGRPPSSLPMRAQRAGDRNGEHPESIPTGTALTRRRFLATWVAGSRFLAACGPAGAARQSPIRGPEAWRRGPRPRFGKRRPARLRPS